MTLDQAFDAGLLIDEAGRPIVSRKQLADAKWITVHPNGAGSKGTPVQISENGTVLAGMGGKFNGKKLGELKGGKSMSLEQFLASHGVSTNPPADPTLHQNRHKSEKRHQEALTRLSKAQNEWSAKKTELTALYKSKLKSGEITAPDEVERLKRKAEAIPESESGQAAARLAAKIEARRLARSGGSAASQHIDKTLSASAERILQSVPSKLKETPEQRQTIEHYVAKHQAAERAILEKFHRERENNPGWSVTGRSGRKISNTATPLENLARESQTLKSIESEMVAKLESMRPASSVTAAEHTKLSNNVTRSVVGLFAGTHSKSEASAAIKALATANPAKLTERLLDIEKSLKSRGSSLESLFGKSGASASLIKSHLNGSGTTIEQSIASQSSEKFTGSWLAKSQSKTNTKTKDPVINTNSSSSEILSAIERHARSSSTSKQRINTRNRMKKSVVESLESEIGSVKSRIRVEMSKGARQGELRDLYAEVSVLERKRDDVMNY